MKKIFTSLLAVLMAVLISGVLTSCGGDSDVDDTRYYDFSIKWSVVDYGDFSKSQANQLIDTFDDTCEDIFEEYTTKEAKEAFVVFMEALRYEFDDADYNITLKGSLFNEDTRKDVTSRTLYITRHGATLK